MQILAIIYPDLLKITHMSSDEYPFSQIKVTLNNNSILLASSLMFPQKGKPEIYLKEMDKDKWRQVDLYAIESIVFIP